uniref:hypothetical protein n=1 Tax=Seonamhaeicola sp. TaxID=1912245 RepID=UPI0035653AAF
NDFEGINKTALEATIKAYQDYIESIKYKNKEEEESINKGRTLADVLKDIKDAREELNNSTKEEAPVILERIRLLEDEKKAWENLNKEVTKLKAILNENDFWGEYAKSIDNVDKAIKNATKGFEEIDVTKANEQIKEFIENWKELQGQKGDGLSFDEIRDAFSYLEEPLGISSDVMAQVFDGIYNGFDNAREGIASFGSLASEVFGSIMDLENQRLEIQLASIDADEERALKFAENEAAIERIEEQADERRAAIQRKQAKNEKAARIVASIAGTANAVVNALGTFPFTPANIALAATVGAIGAAQTAIIAAQKIPEFKHGVRDFEGGLAVVGDGGKSEIVRTDKGIFKTPATDTLVNLPKGADVFSSEDAFLKELTKITDFNGILFDKNMFNLSSLKPSVSIEQNGISKQDLDSVIGKHFSKMEMSNLTIDENGFTKKIIKGHSSTIDFNKRISFKGKSV